MRKTLPALAITAALGGAVAAYASDGKLAAWLAPEAENARTTTGGYGFSVHPAFSHRAELRDAAGRSIELYRQHDVFNLPAGRTAPPAQHVIRLDGGPDARDLGITVNDPKHQVARITVELYGPGHQPGTAGAVAQTLVVENDGKTCPPACGPAAEAQ